MPTPTLANVPLNQIRGLPIVQSGGSAGGSATVGGNVVRKWTAAQTGLENATPVTDANGHVYLATEFLDVSGCRALTALILRTSVQPALVLPSTYPIGGVGSWGLAGAPTYAQALETNDGDTSITQSADVTTPSIPMRVALARASAPGTAGWSLNLVARGAAAGTSPAIGITVLTGCNNALGGGVAVFPSTAIMPAAASPSGYATFTLAIAPADAATMLAGMAAPGSFLTVEMLNGAGTGTPGAVVNATQVYLDVGGALLPAESPITAWFQQRVDSSDTPPTSLAGGGSLEFCGMSQVNTVALSFPATTAPGQTQRALRCWDVAEVMGIAGTVGMEQADGRLVLSFGTAAAEPNARWSVYLWGTT